MKSVFVIVLIFFSGLVAEEKMKKDAAAIAGLVSAGQFARAQKQVDKALQKSGLEPEQRQIILFQVERMARMRLDFTQTREQVYAQVRQVVPGVTDNQLADWEFRGKLEFLDIDGNRLFFKNAAVNLFHVEPEARALKEKLKPPVNEAWAAMKENISAIAAETGKGGGPLAVPKTFRIRYALEVRADAVPAGEKIRCWLPFPHDSGRQKNVRILEVDPSVFILAGDDQPQRTISFEKRAEAGKPTRFQVVFQYTVHGFRAVLEEEKAKPLRLPNPELLPFLSERKPHIVFTPELRNLAGRIAGGEKNPVLLARKILTWIGENIPRASAREYSTIDSLCLYAFKNRWGDCGIQTMLFITLCRVCGIPARWQSGWTTGANWNMHDWCQVFLEPWGWVPADPSYGLMPADDERIRWFYLGGVDSYRLVVCEDYGVPLRPAKVHFRSEPLDFQRGEVEWSGGNLYFDKWDWEFRAVEIK